jgi:uncharacterized protein (TIGR03437 family)
VVVTVTATVTPNTSGPSISANGIRTASDFGFFQSATPGTFIEIYGSNLSTTSPGRPWDNDFKGTTAPTSLDNTSVTIDGRKAFVQYVSPGQVNALLPSDVGTGQVQVTLANTAGTSNSYTLTVNQVQPGLFAPASFKIGDKQYVAAFVGPDYRSTFALPTGAIPGRPSRPARQGETLVIYAMGLGPVNPSILAGTLFSGATNLTLPLEISFGNTAANVVYKGLAPGFTGLYQLNVVVPQVPDIDAVPLTLKLNGVPGTQTLYIAVHQ